MLFNLDKCAVMHFGFNNIQKRRILASLFRVIQRLTCSATIKAASEANGRLGMIKRNFRFKSRTRRVRLLLYKSIVRPHLD